MQLTVAAVDDMLDNAPNKAVRHKIIQVLKRHGLWGAYWARTSPPPVRRRAN